MLSDTEVFMFAGALCSLIIILAALFVVAMIWWRGK